MKTTTNKFNMAVPSFGDRRDYGDADRGFMAALETGVIKNASGKVLWDIGAWDFMKDDCPQSAHPHLWRQGQLNSKHGLYEICPGIRSVKDDVV
jgi:alkyl sulfatase BDS1-like metallo-beta-lactamase superfamily hydrolase